MTDVIDRGDSKCVRMLTLTWLMLMFLCVYIITLLYANTSSCITLYTSSMNGSHSDMIGVMSLSLVNRAKLIIVGGRVLCILRLFILGLHMLGLYEICL